jgi:hypothetical protein
MPVETGTQEQGREGQASTADRVRHSFRGRQRHADKQRQVERGR